MSEAEIDQVLDELRELRGEVDDLQDKLGRALGGEQPDPDEQLKVWSDAHNPEENISPGSPVISQLVGEITGRATLNGMNTNDVMKFLERRGAKRSRQRVIDIMRAIAEGHPDINLRENAKPMSLHWHGGETLPEVD